MGRTGLHLTMRINNRRAAYSLLAPRPIHDVVVLVALRSGCISMGSGPRTLDYPENERAESPYHVYLRYSVSTVS